MPSHSTSPRTATRLHKFLASAGVASRRQSEQLMLAGRVSVNGKEVRDLAFRLEEGVRYDVRVDGEVVHEQPKHYFAVNKPSGYVCTHRDPARRPQAIDLVPIDGLALFTVGRLDASSEGLLLVTNDGELAQRLARPAFHVKRTYRVQVVGRPTAESLDLLRKGMRFTEGLFHVESVHPIRTQGKSTWLELVLTEGRNREIRRLLARVGHKVVHLERIAFGAVKLGGLPRGDFRELSQRELADLRESVARLPPRPKRTEPRPGAFSSRRRPAPAVAPARARVIELDDDREDDFDDDESWDESDPVHAPAAPRPARKPRPDRRGDAPRPAGKPGAKAHAKKKGSRPGTTKPEARESRRGGARFAGKKKKASAGPRPRRPGRG